ncbi:AAA family ATPase [Streptomyces sp. XM83C]|nr:AAA family ATPase [Streptomyces sp. XM83C]
MQDSATWVTAPQGTAGALPPGVPDGVDGARRVVLFGPPGIGKTTAADELARRWGLPVLRLAPGREDARVPYAGVLELALCLPSPWARQLGAALKDVVDGPGRVEHDGTALRLRGLVTALLREAAPLTLVVDNAQWLDPAGAAVLSWALRLTPDLPVIVAERSWRPESGAHWCGRDAHPVRVPALSPAQLAALLSPCPLSADDVAWIHARSGGNPALALALADAVPLPSERAGGAEPPLPATARRLVGEWLDEVPDAVRELLACAALDDRPDVELLIRVGGPAAETLLSQAETAGLLDIGRPDGTLRFTASAIGTELMNRLPVTARRELHHRLAAACHDPLRRARHTALAATGTTDARTARDAAEAAARARLRGEHPLAAELSLLGAELTPREDAGPLTERALTAIRDAAHCGDLPRSRTAARLVLAHEDSPGPRFEALLTLLDASGQRLNDADELFAAALHEAAGRPDLTARVLLRQALRANVNEGAPERAEALAGRAADLAEAAGDTTTAALALTMRARVRRILGSPGAETALDRALAMPRTAPAPVNATPEHLAARHALFDDRLSDARTLLLPLLVRAQRAGDAEATVDVLRSLAEVEIRAGRCAVALGYAARARTLTDASGLPYGPACYTSALVEGTASRTDHALALARRGVEASRREDNRVFLSRNLFALGHLLLVTGRPKEALEALEEVRALEALQQVRDPSVLRWHADLTECLVVLGHLEQARDLLEHTHRTATELGRHTVLPPLARVRALLDAARGDYDTAARRLTEAAGRLGHLPIEQGRTLLALSHTERRGRRRASAREAARSAADLFTAHEAHPWAEAAARSLDRLEHHASHDTAPPRLTRAEQRCAELVQRRIDLAGVVPRRQQSRRC